MKRSQRVLLGIERPSAYKGLSEKEDWALHGCHNNEEWHIYLKSLFERDLYSDLVDGCYVGVLPETRKRLNSQQQ